MLLDVIEDTLVDALKLLPFLVLTYLAMEYIEHKAGDKAEELVEKAGGFGPLIGSVLGMVPQCGFSAAALPQKGNDAAARQRKAYIAEQSLSRSAQHKVFAFDKIRHYCL